jgi:hypothetical protein
LTIQHRYLMTQRDELKLQFCAAAKPASQPRQERRNQYEHAGDITECRPKSPAFSLLSEFSAAQPRCRRELRLSSVRYWGASDRGAREKTFFARSEAVTRMKRLQTPQDV